MQYMFLIAFWESIKEWHMQLGWNASVKGTLISEVMLHMSLFSGYWHVNRYFVTSEVTIYMRAYGFCPIFLITNTLIPQSPCPPP